MPDFSPQRRHLLLAASGLAMSAAVSAPPHPVAEQGFVLIGGIQQWVAIRGRDRSRPAILFLHGGPCDAQSPHLSLFAPWEERYVVANWDQRGSGQTFTRNGTATPDVTFERITKDAIEVARNVRARTGQRKLILVGHSGALLGLAVVCLQPDLFHAFIGTCQPVNAGNIVEHMRASAIARAQQAGDTEAAAKLQALSAHDLLTEVGLLVKWTEPFIASDLPYLAAPSAFPNDFCNTALTPAMVSADARSGGDSVPIPFFIIQGREDNRTPANEAHAFLDQVHAPAKGYTEIEGGHFACLTNPTAFLDALDRDMRALEIR